ncbi:MAG: hypothetical protein ABFD81_19260 [Syntrophaceae bacterium]
MSKTDYQKSDRIAGDLKAVFHAKDKLNHPGQFVQRKFKDPFHFLRNLFDLLTYTPDLILVYFGRSISPRFREMIMLTVASTNECNA